MPGKTRGKFGVVIFSGRMNKLRVIVGFGPGDGYAKTADCLRPKGSGKTSAWMGTRMQAKLIAKKFGGKVINLGVGQ